MLVELFTYDAMGRLTVDQHPTRPANSPGNPTGSAVTLTDYFTYDGLGQKIQHWNSQLGSSVKETTDYDLQGRVAKTVDMDGYATTYAYAWDSTIATQGYNSVTGAYTTGMGTFGGWVETIMRG